MKHSRKGETTWTPEMDETLRSMASEGLSSTWIGAALGKSRNAVIGRAKRVGINLTWRSARGGGIVSPIARKAPPPPKAPKDRKEPRQGFYKQHEPNVVPDSERAGIPLIDLMSDSCRWPLRNEGEQRFCGELKIHDLPYCWEHIKRAYLGRWF